MRGEDFTKALVDLRLLVDDRPRADLRALVRDAARRAAGRRFAAATLRDAVFADARGRTALLARPRTIVARVFSAARLATGRLEDFRVFFVETVPLPLRGVRLAAGRPPRACMALRFRFPPLLRGVRMSFTC